MGTNFVAVQLRRGMQSAMAAYHRVLRPALGTTMICTRPALESDKPYLVWLEEACMRDYAVALWGAWPPELGVRTSVVGCRIIVADGNDAGCVTAETFDDHVWLDELFIAPAFQRKGIGSHVLRAALTQAQGFGLPVRLSVLTTNPAVRFYHRHGFHVRDRTSERISLTSDIAAAAPHPSVSAG